MNRSPLVRLFGWRAMLIHGDTLVLDRWRWLRRRLPSGEGQALIDVGCGNGAFTIGAAKLGYEAVGLSWDERAQQSAMARARMCGATSASFDIVDVRELAKHDGLQERFSVAVCTEVIEHVLDDARLMADIAACLRPGGLLLLTTPNVNYRPMSPEDEGPWSTVEDGGHVRRGYDEQRLRELCAAAGLTVKEISFCSGFLSQMTTRLMRRVSPRGDRLAWLVSLPLRPLAPLLDSLITRIRRWPSYSICLVAEFPSRG